MGRYFLKKSWKEVILALGVYALVAWLVIFGESLRANVEYDVSMQVFVSLGMYLSALFNGLIVWLFARAFGLSYGRSLLLAAAVVQLGSLATYIWSFVYMKLWVGDIFDGTRLVAMEIARGVLDYLIPSALYMLMLSGIFRLPWKRSVLCTFTILLPGLLCTLYFFLGG